MCVLFACVTAIKTKVSQANQAEEAGRQAGEKPRFSGGRWGASHQSSQHYALVHPTVLTREGQKQ